MVSSFLAECYVAKTCICNCIAKFRYHNNVSSVGLSSVMLIYCDKTTGDCWWYLVLPIRDRDARFWVSRMINSHDAQHKSDGELSEFCHVYPRMPSPLHWATLTHTITAQITKNAWHVSWYRNRNPKAMTSSIQTVKEGLETCRKHWKSVRRTWDRITVMQSSKTMRKVRSLLWNPKHYPVEPFRFLGCPLQDTTIVSFVPSADLLLAFTER